MTTNKLSKPATKRLELRCDDLDRLVAFWERMNINGTFSELFHQTIDHIYSLVPGGELPLLAPTTPVVGEASPLENEHRHAIAEDISWLVAEVNRLRDRDREFSEFAIGLSSEIANLNTTVFGDRKGEATPSSNMEQNATILQQAEELSTLQAQNDRLQQELAEMKSKFAAVAQVFGLDTSIAKEIVTDPPAPATDSPPPPLSPGLPSLRDASRTAIDPPLSTTTKVDGRAVRKNRSLDLVERVVDAVLSWNNQQDRSDRRILLSLTALKPLCLLVEAASQPVIQQVLNRRRDEITNHHATYALGKHHNAKVDLLEILRAIAKDELHLPNWDRVKC